MPNEQAPLLHAEMDAIREFQHAVRAWLKDPCAGTRHALEMAATELQLLGIDPSDVGPS